MQCSHCGFHNLPGTHECFSCHVPFGRTATAVLTPPRAPSWRKRLRAFHSLPRVRPGAMRQVLVASQALLGLLPGLHQIVLGRRRLGAAFLGAWILLLALAFVWIGTATCTLLAGLALSTHVFSALHPYQEAMRPLPLGRRCLVSLATWAILLLAVYLPLQRGVDSIVFPLRIPAGIAAPSFKEDDVVLVRRVNVAGWRPARGRVVAFTHAWGGPTMDRVLGVAGDHIEVLEGTFVRNGVPIPPAERPLNPAVVPATLDVVVPEGSVFVWPSLGMRIYNEGNVDVARFGVVSLRSMLGVPWRIWQPWSRRRVLEP